MRLRAHDLLWLHAPTHGRDTECPVSIDGVRPAPPGKHGWPYWANPAWPVVVRRDRHPDASRIPVGIRGRQRQLRQAAWTTPCFIRHCLRPEQITRQRAWPVRHEHDTLPALDALLRLAPALDELALTWGPVGSVGFALAIGDTSILRPASDLDLLIRAPRPLDRARWARLERLPALACCRLDIQLETGAGAFSLMEWLTGRPRILLKTRDGPRLVEDPWDEILPGGA